MIRSFIGFVAFAIVAHPVGAQFSLRSGLPTPAILHQEPTQLPTVRNPREMLATVDLTGRNSWDWMGEPLNERATTDLGALLGTPGVPVRVTGIGWDTTLSTVGGSLDCEAAIVANESFYFSVGTNCSPVTNAPFSSGGVIDLVVSNQDFLIMDGVLNVEWFEWYDNYPGEIDATYHSGELTIAFEEFTIPDPPKSIDLGAIAIAGERVAIDTVGSDFEGMLALYGGTGELLMLGASGNFGGPILSSILMLRNADPGTYYVGLGSYYTEFRPYWDARTTYSFYEGNYVLNYTETDSITGYLGPQSVEWFKFEVVPEPASALFVLAGGSMLVCGRRRTSAGSRA